MTKPGVLYLVPNLIHPHRHHQPYLPNSIDKVMQNIDGLIAESAGDGRRYLGRFETKKPAHQIPLALFNTHTNMEDLDFLLEPLVAGERWALVSDAGLPCIADPGYQLVRRAKECGIAVQAFVGPCSITLSLMLSGLPAQNFHFHGYLNKDYDKRREELVALEKQSETTHLFIEAPHRNNDALEVLLEVLQPETSLCVAWELTSPDQGVVTETVEAWRKSTKPNIKKRNTIFLFSS